MSAQNMVCNFFDKLLSNEDRRLALLCRWLTTIPKTTPKTTVVDIFENIFEAIVVLETCVTLQDNGITLNKTIVIANEWLLADELETVRYMKKNKTMFFDQSKCKYNHLIFTETQRQLMCRDFVNICFLQQRHWNKLLWPLYALHATQRLMFVKKYAYIHALADAHDALQGLCKSTELPIYNNINFNQ
jgi:hypothetical protein